MCVSLDSVERNMSAMYFKKADVNRHEDFEETFVDVVSG
jgi:hypothetical protein